MRGNPPRLNTKVPALLRELGEGLRSLPQRYPCRNTGARPRFLPPVPAAPPEGGGVINGPYALGFPPATPAHRSPARSRRRTLGGGGPPPASVGDVGRY